MTRDELVEAVRHKRLEVGISLRQLANETGLSFKTCARLNRGGYAPDAQSFAVLSRWLNGATPEARQGARDSEIRRLKQRVAHLEILLGVKVQ